jgi:hypothetical protein
MGEMRIEWMRQANLTIGKLMEVAICKDRCLKISEQPIFDVGANGLDRIESERRSVIKVGMKHPDTRIEPIGEQGNRHFGFEDSV